MSNENTNKMNRSISQYLSVPATNKFLEEQLKEKKSSFVSNLIAMTNGDTNLQECDPQKLMMCAMNATALNLPLNKGLGYAYVIPYKSGDTKVPQFQIGYKGLIQLAIRTNAYKYINTTVVREKEIQRNKFTGEISVIGEYPNNTIIGYLATLKLISGFEASVYMTEEEIEKHAKKYSKVYQNDIKYNSKKSLWSDPEERPKMANKTVLKSLLSTYGVLSIELEKALTNDSDNEVIDTVARDVTDTPEGKAVVSDPIQAKPTKKKLSEM